MLAIYSFFLTFINSVAWSGFLKPSGTFGSAASLALAFYLFNYCLPEVGIRLSLIPVIFLSWLAIHLYLKLHPSKKDPSEIVIDELAGLWVTLALLPSVLLTNEFAYLIAFLTFRFFDITKVQPASWADKKLPGALGVLTDDLIAGVYALGATLFFWEAFTFLEKTFHLLPFIG